jgi:hypothetical protein
MFFNLAAHWPVETGESGAGLLRALAQPSVALFFPKTVASLVSFT